MSNLKERYKKAKQAKHIWNSTYQDAAQYAMPERENFYDDSLPGESKTGAGRIYDSTAQVAFSKFVSNLQSSMIPTGKQWAELTAGGELEGNIDFRKALQQVSEIFFNKMNDSNFDTAAAEAFHDLGLGTGAIMVHKGQKGGVGFSVVPLKDFMIDEGPRGTIGNVYRDYKMPFRNVQETWPDAEIPDEVKSKFQGREDENIELVEATQPKKVKVASRVSQGKEEVDGYLYEVYTKDFKEKLVSRNMRTSPFIIFRWEVTPGEVYGRGPLLKALPDIRVLNKTKELLLKNASINVTGAYTVVDDGTVNIQNLKIQPGSFIPVAANDGSPQGPTIAALPRSGDVNVSQIVLEDVIRSVNDILFTDPLGPIDLPVKTATEISLRQQELSKRIGSAFGRLQREFLNPLVERVLDVLDEQGEIDLGQFRVDGDLIKIKYTSPLAASEGEEKVMRMVQFARNIVETFGQQALMMVVNPMEYAKRLSKHGDVDAEILNGEEEFQQFREILTQQLQQQAQQQEQQPQPQTQQGL